MASDDEKVGEGEGAGLTATATATSVSSTSATTASTAPPPSSMAPSAAQGQLGPVPLGYYQQAGPPQGYPQFGGPGAAGGVGVGVGVGGFPTYVVQPGLPQGMYTYPIQLPQFGMSPSQITTRSKRKQVKNACVNCQKACKKCDDTRPCARCMKYGQGDSCLDSLRKERKKGIKRGPYKRRKDREPSPGERLVVGQSSESTTVDPSNPTGAYGHPYSNIQSYGNVSFDPTYSTWRYDQNPGQFQGYAMPYAQPQAVSGAATQGTSSAAGAGGVGTPGSTGGGTSGVQGDYEEDD